MHLVSIIIPCFNGGTTLEKTVESAKAQTWPHTEIIIIDDGSTDQLTLRVLNAIPDVVLIRQPNLGLPAARNAGFRAARGEYVLPLDSDDQIEPEMIATLMKAIESNAHNGFAYCDARLEGEASGTLQKHYNFFEQLFLNQLPYCLLVPRKIWFDAGGYDETMRSGYEDWEFNIRLGRHGYHGLRIPMPLFRYRVSSSGMLISKSNHLHGLLWKEIQTRHSPIYKPLHLYKMWRVWSHKPSQHPLPIYWIWLGLHRLLPNSVFSRLFRMLRARNRQRRNGSVD